MTSTTGIQGRTTTGAWPRVDWARIRQVLADQVDMTRTSVAASRAYAEAPSDAARRRVMADFLQSLR